MTDSKLSLGDIPASSQGSRKVKHYGVTFDLGAEIKAMERREEERRIREVANLAREAGSSPIESVGPLEWPPNGLGALSRLIHASSIRPVPEVAISTALAWMAGMCGRSWTVSGTGLNLYLILLARSAIGKEAIQDATQMLIQAVQPYRQDVTTFFDFREYASGQALTKATLENSCFVQLPGEWGRRMKKIASGTDMASNDLRTVMTKLYSKSGRHSVAGGIAYSNPTNTVASSAGGIAYSFLGESTPGTFRESLSEDMMEDGFLSRFTIIEYTGDRPPRNASQLRELPADWAKWFADLTTYILSRAYQPAQEVPSHPDAASLLDEFDRECDTRIVEAGEDESRRQMWNRAHLKVLRISALQAIVDTHLFPTINTTHVQWAIGLVRRDIACFMSRSQSGDIGTGDKEREAKLLALMMEYTLRAPSAGYGVPEPMRLKGIIQRKYLQQRVASLPSFRAHKLGATPGLDHALRSLGDSGYIKELDRKFLLDQFKEFGKCYAILRMK